MKKTMIGGFREALSLFSKDRKVTFASYTVFRGLGLSAYVLFVAMGWCWIYHRNGREDWQYRASRNLSASHLLWDEDLLDRTDMALPVRMALPGREQWVGRFLNRDVAQKQAILPGSLAFRPLLTLRPGGRPVRVDLEGPLARNLSAGDVVRVLGPESCAEAPRPVATSGEAKDHTKRPGMSLDVGRKGLENMWRTGDTTNGTENPGAVVTAANSTQLQAPLRELAAGVRVLAIQMDGAKAQVTIELFPGHSDARKRIGCGLTLEIE